jgi:hypothetical protein
MSHFLQICFIFLSLSSLSAFRVYGAEQPNQFDLVVSYCNGALQEPAKSDINAHQAVVSAQNYLNDRIASGLSPTLLLPSALQGTKDWEKLSGNISESNILNCLKSCGVVNQRPVQNQCAIDCWKQADQTERNILLTCLHIDHEISNRPNKSDATTK